MGITVAFEAFNPGGTIFLPLFKQFFVQKKNLKKLRKIMFLTYWFFEI